MSEEVTPNKMIKVLDKIYEKALTGIPGLDSVYELAESYIKDGKTPYEHAAALIKWQSTKSGVSGFVTSFGGFATLPITLPANMTSVLYIQIRMIAAIAYIGGYDLKNDKVKTLVYTCLLGNGALEVIKDVGIQVGKKLSMKMIEKIPGEVIKKINQRIGFRLMTKFGETGVVNLHKLIPVAGGFFGGAVDFFSTKTIGKTARKVFIGK